jgi:N-acetylglutamate synthase-like GNAT family acetyltransferase
MKPVYHLHPAKTKDMPAIRSLIRETGINPLGLDRQRFIVAVNSDHQVIGTGQIKIHRDGARELASIAVRPDWRRQGVARAIIERLLSENSGILYLTCREHLGQFYARFGFQVIERYEMPAYFRRVATFFSFLDRLGVMKEGLLVMSRPEKIWLPSTKKSVDVLDHNS